MANSSIFSKVRELVGEFEVVKVLDDAQTLNTTSDEVDVQNAKNLCLYTVGNSTPISGGTVVIEGSPLSGHGGTWKSLGSITVPAGTALGAVAVTDGDDGFPTRFVRARVSAQVANGNIDAYLIIQR